MALAQHLSIEVRHEQQVVNAREYVLPFISESVDVSASTRVLEIGCGEGGVLIPFQELGMQVVGVDLDEYRIGNALRLNAEAVASGQAKFLYQNVYEESFLEAYRGSFDLIILKDTIEHIPNQAQFIRYMLQLLSPKGAIFFGFPPWRMPFGGHQQICRNKFMGAIPWYHLLPKFIYKGVLQLAREPKWVVDELMNVRSTRISLGRFEQIIRDSDLRVLSRKLFLINPIYKFKFGWKPREQAKWMADLPWVRDFFTTAGWYVVAK